MREPGKRVLPSQSDAPESAESGREGVRENGIGFVPDCSPGFPDAARRVWKQMTRRRWRDFRQLQGRGWERHLKTVRAVWPVCWPPQKALEVGSHNVQGHSTRTFCANPCRATDRVLRLTRALRADRFLASFGGESRCHAGCSARRTPERRVIRHLVTCSLPALREDPPLRPCDLAHRAAVRVHSGPLSSTAR